MTGRPHKCVAIFAAAFLFGPSMSASADDERFTHYIGDVQVGAFHCPVEWTVQAVQGQPEQRLFGCATKDFRFACMERKSVLITCVVEPASSFD